MTDKYIYYDYEGRNLKVPVGEQSEFESRVPDAKMMLTYEGKNYKVPLSELSNFTDRVGEDNLTYSAFDDNREYVPKLSVDRFMSYSAPNADIEEQDEHDRPGLGETVLKGIGAAGVGTAKTALDLGRMAFNTSVIGGIARAIAGRDLKEDILDESNPWTKASMRLGELQEELSREADPTGGQQGFVDLLSERKVGMALQKALGSGIESLPMMLAASTGAGALIYGAGMAASTYSDETRENPDIPDWKRGINAIGSAALEMAVERIGGPLKNAFGKAGGELTEEMAKELLENVAKEGTESIAKRIAKGLLNVGKEGLEEGGEELLTSFGNDALGEALDLIDGDKDYGIRAQWEKAKEENPNISVGDFAKSKAKEYLDSFIGGALSGMQISGATGAINYVAKNEDLASREINKKRELGASLDYGNMYDVDDVVNETINNVEQSFVNKDGEPALSREFIASLSSDQAFELARREDAPAEQRNAFYNLAKAKATQEGLNSKLDQKLNEKIAADRAIIEGATENGKVLSADYGGKTVYVKGGVIKKSRITLPDGNHGPVIVIDSATGEQQTVNTKDLGALEYLEADKLITLNENTLREGENRLREQARTTMSPLAKAKAVLPFARKKILVDVGNGITEVFVESISPKGEVMIKGKKGDLGGQSILTMNAATFYDSIHRDDDGNPVVTEVEQGAEEEVTDTPVVETTEDVDYGDYEGPILVGGRLVDVMETQQDKPSNTVNYTYVDENGDMRVGSMTIDEFGAAVKQAEEQTKNPVPAPETAPIESPEPVVNEPTPTPEPAPEEITEETDWDALFEHDTVAFYDEVKKQFGDKAMDFLNMEIQATQNEISSLEKNMGKSTNERAKNFSKLASLRLKLGSLNEMAELLEKQSNPVTETPTETPTEVPTEPVDETPTEPVDETPVEPTEEPQPTPAEPIQTENGFIIVDKVITNPEVIEMPNTPEGDANRIFIGEYNGKWTYGAEALMDNKSWGKTPEMRIENARYDTREDAIKGAIGFLENQWRDKRKEAGSKALDAFLEYVSNNYLSNTSDSQGNSVTLEDGENENNNGVRAEDGTGGGEYRPSDNADGNESDGGGNQSESETDTEGGAILDSESGEENPVDKYPVRNGDVTQDMVKTAFGFSHVSNSLRSQKTLNTVYDTLMGMAKMLGISPKSIGHGGRLGLSRLGDRVDSSTWAWYERGRDRDGNVARTIVSIRDTHISSLLHEWWHSLDHALNYTNTGKGSFTTSVGKANFTGRQEVLNAVNAVMKAIKSSGHIGRIERAYYGPSHERYLKSKKEATARAFEEYILGKFAESGIAIEGIERENISSQPTAEEMKVIAPAFDKLFKVLKEKEGKEAGTSILYHIAQDLKQNDEVKQQMGALVADWIQKGGNFVVMDSAAMEQALMENGLLQEAKLLRRTIVNSDLTNEEKKKIKEYILSLPKDISTDRPYMVKFDGYAYIFNASRRFFEENTTKKPKGDGFEILHKRELASLSELETRLLDATYGEDRGDISEMLQILGIDKGRSGNSSSVTTDAGTEGNNGRLDEAEHREGASTDGSNLGSLRDTGDVQKLETPDGTIFGFVKDGVVYLDPTLLNPNTSIHEYTHLWDNALMQLNPALWEKGKALMKKTSIWKEVINDPNYADIKNNEDLVASEVHSRLVGIKGAERLNQLEQEARAKGLTKGAKELSILGRLREWINEATQWLKDAFTAWSKEELDAVTLSDFLNMPLRDLANFKTLPKAEPQQVINENGELVANDNGNGKIQFSISTWRDGGRDYLVNWLKNDKTLTKQEKEDILARMDEFYENALKYTDVYVPFGSWSEAAVKYDKDGNPLMSVIKKNGDYSMNLDFSLVCKKRRPLNKLLRTLINRNAFGTYSLRERELAEINWILQEHGFEVACALCFVDSKRYRVTGVADVFAELYNKFVKALAPEGTQIAHFNYSNNPNIESVENGLDTLSDEQLNWDKFNELANQYEPTTVEGKVAKFLRENPSQRRLVDATDFIDASGFEAVKEGNPALLSLYNSKKGTGGPKASFGDVQYLNDILKKSRSFTAGRAYDVGGVRLQSFSDFVPHMYFDYMQLFAELTAKKLPAHAYTKEVLFAKIFGLTGLKINMSLVPAVVEGGIAPGLDANGNYAWADAVKDKDGNIIQQAQSFPFDEAMAIQNAEGYSKNCGVIAVGISDEHIEKMLNDPNIPFIIPYHKSSLNAIVARMTNIDQYKDYTNVQNTKKADGTKLDEGAKDFNFNAWLRKNKGATPKDAAQAYLDWCKKNNYRPKFSQFAYHPNYYKLLVDFNTVDARTGEYTPQGAVTMTFPTGDNAFGDVETLIQQGLQEDAELEEKMDPEIEEVANEVEKRLAEIKDEPEMSEKEYAQKMAELADERMARIKEKAEDDGILSRSGDVTPEMDAAYMEAVEAGDMETAQRMVIEAAKLAMPNTKVMDKKGNPTVVYHGTKGKFNTFAYSREDIGFHFGTKGTARTRIGRGKDARIMQVLLNLENPLIFDTDLGSWDADYIVKDLLEKEMMSYEEAKAILLTPNGYKRNSTSALVELRQWMISNGYDGIVYPNWFESNGKDSYIAFNRSQIKSADAVTYDDNGNVIPLSERFNPEKNDIRYRRSTPVEFHKLEVDNFLSKYNPNCEVIVFPINERTAKEFGYTLEELKEKHGRYIPSYDFIAIFAREDLMDRSSIEDTLFHESIHKLAQSSGYEYMVEAGKWMWENASNNEVLSDYKEIVEEGYKNKSLARKHEEMLCHVLAGAMESGHVEWLLKNVSEDTASILNEILNEIGYESAAETRERRARESVSQSAVAENLSDAESENAGQSSRRGYAGATGRPENAESGRRITVENQNAAVNLHTGDTRDGIIERAVSEEAQKLGVNVTFAKRSEMAKGHETDKGYYNTKTGEIVICPENNASIADAIQTILHEAVAHKGLRQLMGDKFDEFINRVYDSLDAKTKEKVDKLAKDHYKGNKAVAMEEYMATLAESEDFNDKTIWDKIVEIFEDIINKILDRDDFTIGDKELRYILRASYNNMANPRNMETVRGWAQEQMMREEYKINKATPELLSRTGIDPTHVSSETAKAVYDRVVSSQWQEFERQFQDAMQPVRIAIDAIQQETGNIPIEDYENYILIQNHASSRSRVEIDEFERRYFGPIVDKVNEVVTAYIKATGGNVDNEQQRAAVYKMIKNYLIAKHGLERNQYYQLTKKRKLTPYEKKKEIDKLTEEYETKVNDIRNDSTLNDTEKELEIHKEAEALRASIIEVNERLVPDLRDYSGLTTLFGFPPRQYKKAEEEAKKYVADIEKKLGRVDDEDGNVVTESPILTEMWDKIKSATDKTLRHSYECGLLSRGQYEEIKDMFTHYIPLRGYDETTAEDVYSYSRFEGNRFNPAVQTVKGRTSLAEDPLAIIMNMAESEIAQGNKNRAKQALYNYLLNRSAGNKDQNSLMQIESVWYLVNYDEAGNEYFTIAAPNHEAGETYEEFEARMIALEEEEKAFKSKKGKVNVGMRFQKQMDRNSHYVYLKVNGVEKAIYINGDPKAADAINGTYYPKSNAVVDKIKDVNRFISSTFTNYSLSFTARNFVRDAIYSRINMSIRESDPAYRKQFRKNYWHAFGNMRKLIKAYRNGELDGRDLNPEEAAFVEFMRNGGQTGYTVINSVENHKKELERAIKRMQRGTYNGGGKSGFIAMFKWIELMNESSELLTRFVAYKTSRDMGRGIETSIGNAKEITVNFNTRGAQDGTGILGSVANYFGWSKYFFNASVQGVQNLTAMAKANKIKFCETVGGIIGFGFAMPFIHALASLWGDDDENEYWNIPEYDRQNNICIQAFGTYIKIPLPIGFREMYAIGDTMAAALCDKKFTRDLGQIGKDMANKVASIVLPINPLESAANGLDLWQTGAYAILPSGLQFVMQNMTNIDWKGAPLQKEYTYNEHDPQWTKAFASNPKWMTGLSKWCNENINLDGDFDGMDWSPEKLDNTLSNVFGGMYSLVKQTGKSIYTMFSKDKDFNVMSVPLVGVVLSSGIDEDDRFITDAYYDMKEYYDENVNSIKRTAKAFGYDLKEVFSGENVGAHHPRMQRIYNNRNFDFMQEWYAGNKELESLKNKIEYREKKIAGMDEVPNELMEEIAALKNELENERREFVNDMLELD